MQHASRPFWFFVSALFVLAAGCWRGRPAESFVDDAGVVVVLFEEDAGEAGGEGGGGDGGDGGSTAAAGGGKADGGGGTGGLAAWDEDCTNGLDDNGNTLVDCADPFCEGRLCGWGCLCENGLPIEFDAGAAAGEGGGGGEDGGGGSGGSNISPWDEDCWNGVDDNDNSLIDCHDPYCESYSCGPDCTCLNGLPTYPDAGAGGGGGAGGAGGGEAGGAGGGVAGGAGGGTSQNTGVTCDDARDVTGAAFPVYLPGMFTDDPLLGFSCDSSPTNTVWYSFTAPDTGNYRFTASNATGTIAYSRLAIQEGTACVAYGPAVSCTTATSTSISSVVTLNEGVSYLIAFFTDGESYTMVNPTLNIEFIPPPAANSGRSCLTARDVSADSFPATLSGVFDDSPGAGFTCDTSPTNTVWYTFTAPESGNYAFSATNATGTAAYSRLAITQTAACSPYGPQVACAMSSSTSISSTAALVEGLTYLIAFFTDGESYTMVNPTLSIGQPVEVLNGCEAPWCSEASGPNGGALLTYVIPPGSFPAGDDFAGNVCTVYGNGSDLRINLDVTGYSQFTVDTCTGASDDSSVAAWSGPPGTGLLSCNGDAAGQSSYCARVGPPVTSGGAPVPTALNGPNLTVVVDEYSAGYYWSGSSPRTIRVELIP